MAVMAAAAITTAAMGAGQLISGAVKSKKAKAMRPALEDSEQRMELARLKRQASKFETGAAFNKERAALSNAIKQQVAGAGRISGGAGGAAIAAGARGAMNIGQIVSKLGVQGQQLGMQQRQLASAAQAGISQRKLELQMHAATQKKAEAEQAKKAGIQNLMSGALSFAGGAAGGMGKGAGEAGTAVGGGAEAVPSIVEATGGSGGMGNMSGTSGISSVFDGGFDPKSVIGDMDISAANTAASEVVANTDKSNINFGNPDDKIFGSDPKKNPFANFDFSSVPSTISSMGKNYDEFNLLSQSMPLIEQLMKLNKNKNSDVGSENFDSL